MVDTRYFNEMICLIFVDRDTYCENKKYQLQVEVTVTWTIFWLT